MVELNPGANAAAELDFTIADNVKFYYRAIKGLDDAMKYDLAPSGLRTFLDKSTL
jgi:hypothetical protein